VEPDRAPPLLLHHDELARQAARLAETIINLIGATKTSTGLEVYARLDDRDYPAKIRVTDAELDA